MAVAGAEVYELKNGSLEVKLTNWGATIISLLVPDAHGNVADVVLGFDSLQPYLEGESPYFGCIVGRVANRIRHGRFTLDGAEYTLPINNPPNSLHGGHRGFDKVLWEVAAREDGEIPSITFKYISRDGEEGYPGEVEVTAKYSLPSSTALRVDMAAVTSKATPISLAQHTYWNLAGHDAGHVLDHGLRIWATHWTPVDQDAVPTGQIEPVAGTPLDFTAEERVGSRIGLVGGGYDHNLVLGGGAGEEDGLKRAARLREPRSGRALELWTDAPGMQLYSGNFLAGVPGKGGAVYGKHAGLCLETQGFPNAVNQPNFPSVVVRPGQEYRHFMLFHFSAPQGRGNIRIMNPET
ncbi:LOW QUALITY PROTEIN: uncharacterized protein LOC144712380 [Wolffia australiana]